MHGDAMIVTGEGHTNVFAMLEERRANHAAQWVRTTNQTQAVLRDLVPGGAAVAVTAKSASVMLRSIRPESQAGRTRKELARDLVRDLRAVDESLTDIEFATMTYVDWFNRRHLRGEISNDARYTTRPNPRPTTIARQRQTPRPSPDNQGRFHTSWRFTDQSDVAQHRTQT